MLRCWMLIALLVVLAAGRTVGAELTGFGPIKFGMTKEQAKAALAAAGIEGEWDEERPRFDLVKYGYPLHDRATMSSIPEGTKLKVRQLFDDDRAIDVTIDLHWPYNPPESCFTDALYFVSAIKNKYKNPVVIKQIVDDRYISIDKVKINKGAIYVISFENESFIQMLADFPFGGTDKDKCHFWVWYHAPVPNPIPF